MYRKRFLIAAIICFFVCALIIGVRFSFAADVAITGLDAITDPNANDVLVIVDDVSGTATTKKITYGNLVLNLIDTHTITKSGTAKSNMDILQFTNSINAADMDGTETSILWNQYYYDANTPATADAARLSIGTEQDWTSTASTQDAYMALEVALNGTVTERLRLISSGYLGLGTTAPSSPIDVEIAGTAESNLDILELTNSGNDPNMDGTETSILFNQFYYDANTPALADAGRISVGTETNWTSTASTNDSYIDFETCLNGTVARQVRIESDGDMIHFGNYNYVLDPNSNDDTYTGTLPGLTAYKTGLLIYYHAMTANTGACTLNLNSLGAKSIKMLHDQDPADNYIESGAIVNVIYDGTNFQLLSPDANP